VILNKEADISISLSSLVVHLSMCVVQQHLITMTVKFSKLIALYQYMYLFITFKINF